MKNIDKRVRNGIFEIYSKEIYSDLATWFIKRTFVSTSQLRIVRRKTRHKKFNSTKTKLSGIQWIYVQHRKEREKMKKKTKHRSSFAICNNV